MKLLFLRLLLLVVFASYKQVSKSQHTSDNTSERVKTVVPLSNGVAELQLSLQRASSPRQKADILYELANTYLGIFKIDSSMHFSAQLRELAITNNYLLGLGKYHLVNAGACFLRNRGQEVLDHLDTAISIFQPAKSDLYLGLSYRLKGRQLGQFSDNLGAQKYYRISIDFIRRSGHENYLQRALHDFGRNFYFSFEVDSAALYLTQALRMAEQMNNIPKIFNTAAVLGSVYLLSNEMDAAAKTLKYALEICPPDVDKVQLRGVLANYAEVLILTGRFTEVEKILKDHDKINSQLGDLTGQMNDKKLKGFLMYSQGLNHQAIQYLGEAYAMKDKIGKLDFDITTVALYLGAAELKENMIKEAIVHFHHARQLSLKYHFTATLMDAERLLADAFEKINNNDSAYYYFRSHSSIKDSIFIHERDKTVLELDAKYNTEKKEYEIKELQKEKELQDKTIEAQYLLGQQRRQQLAFITQQSEVNKLRASEQSLALQSKNKEFLQKQKELEAAKKESRLQHAVASKEAQNKKLLFVIIFAGLLTGCYGIYRYRQTENIRRRLAFSLTELKQAQQQLIQAEKQNEAQNIRQRISRDIHDEVGATLSGVVLFSEIARQKIGKDISQDAGEYLDHIYSNSKEMLEKMSDIVWAINPKNDSFEKIIFKLKTYAMNLCSGKGISLHFTIDETLFQYSASMQNRKNIYLLIKEGLNNAVKYSMADNIYLDIKKDNQFLRIELRDDGKGFELQDQGAGNGIGNMQARALELGSDLTIKTASGKGTTIRLEFEFHPIEVHDGVPA